MKKVKLLTVVGVLLAMGVVACNGQKSEDQNPSSDTPASQPSSEAKPSSEDQKPSSDTKPSSSEAPKPQKDQTGHIWGADADIAGDAENNLVAYKRAVCTEEDNAVKYTVNQSVVTYDVGGRKDGTPEGYTKLNANGDIMSFKFSSDKYLKGKMYLFGCMDGWSSNSAKKAFSYNGNPNIEVKVNGEALDIDALKDVVYTDFLSGNDSSLSDDGYGFIGDIVLQKGVNEISYKRLASMNTLVKDFVFVGEEFENEWGEAQNVAAGDGGIAYTKYESNLDDKVKIEWKALDGTYAEGSSTKDGTPEGFLKLNSNNMSISYALNISANLDGQIYQRGAMDGYPGNRSCTYFSQTKGAEYGNFEVKVNDSKVYIGDKRAITYGEMLGEEAATGEAAIGSGYSEVKDCLIGDCFLKNGLNTASFTRIDSYNLAISYFVFIGKPGNAHTNPAADADFAGQDDNSHWQVSEGDSFKFNRTEHIWVADESIPDTPSTCAVAGAKHEKCSTCNKTREIALPLDANAHSFTEGTKNGALLPISCSICHSEGYQLDVTDASGFHAPAKMKSDATWNVTGIAAGTYNISVYSYMDNDGNRSSQGFINGNEIRYQWKVDDGEYVSPSTGTSTYADVGVGKADKVYCWTTTVATITIGENATSFVMHWAGSGYSIYVSGLRLLKTAA